MMLSGFRLPSSYAGSKAPCLLWKTKQQKPHQKISASVGMSNMFWLPACVRVPLLACQFPMMGTVCKCHFEAHNQKKNFIL